MKVMRSWFAERVPISGEQLRELTNEPVPNHLKRWWFCLGGTPAYLFVIQIVTGILLAFYYQASPGTAHDSIRYITDEATYGWYFRTGTKESFGRMGRLRPADEASWESRELWSPSFSTEQIVSATGAGDSSIAGFIAAMIREHSIEECLTRANSAGWQNLTSLDALSGLKSWRQIEKNISRLEVNQLHFLNGSGWVWDEKLRVWEKA